METSVVLTRNCDLEFRLWILQIYLLNFLSIEPIPRSSYASFPFPPTVFWSLPRTAVIDQLLFLPLARPVPTHIPGAASRRFLKAKAGEATTLASGFSFPKDKVQAGWRGIQSSVKRHSNLPESLGWVQFPSPVLQGPLGHTPDIAWFNWRHWAFALCKIAVFVKGKKIIFFFSLSYGRRWLMEPSQGIGLDSLWMSLKLCTRLKALPPLLTTPTDQAFLDITFLDTFLDITRDWNLTGIWVHWGWEYSGRFLQKSEI